MSVATLRAAIEERARELRVPALMAAGLVAHKRGWRDCPCSWCAKKREATIVIGSHTPSLNWFHMNGVYTDGAGARQSWREDKRKEYRAALKRLEEQD